MDMPEKVAALILVAPAINFVTYYYDMLYKLVDQKVIFRLLFLLHLNFCQEKDMLDSGNLVILKKNYGNIFLRKEFSDDSVGHHLDLKKPLNINVPVRILHGVQVNFLYSPLKKLHLTVIFNRTLTYHTSRAYKSCQH